MKNGYKNVYWMRDGINGWKEAGYPVVDNQELLKALVQVHEENDFSGLLVTEKEARKLENCNFVDFRDKENYNKKHIKDARHVEYKDMFSKPMQEELNKSNHLVIIHDQPVEQGVIAATLKLMDYPHVYILK